MNLVYQLKRLLYRFRNTPLHPQWLLYKDEKVIKNQIAGELNGNILDIGSGQSEFAAWLKNKNEVNYFCLDYPNTASRYQNQPDVFADGQQLPVGSETMNYILLLQVLEHIPSPDQCLSEVFRVLKVDGCCYIALPFLYPIHDSPNDFHRWTEYGLKNLFKKHGFKIEYINPMGRSLETAGLILNIAIAIFTRDAISKRNPLALFALVAPIVFFINNLFCWLLSRLNHSRTMPHGYSILVSKAAN